MLVIRLVNGISDSSQKGRVAMSVANLAEDAGIPRILVDVRHDASHNELPSLALLRLASTAAVSWLSSAYWQRQADHLLSCRAHISSLLQRYIELQRAAFLKQATMGKAEEEDSLPEDAADVQAQTETYSSAVGQKQRREVMAEMWERVHAAADLLIGPLLDDGLLEAQQESSNSGKLSSEQVPAAVWEAVMQGLTGTWPQLKQLLLAAAIQRLCSTLSPSPTDANAGLSRTDCGGVVSRADALAQWVGKLLGVPREDGQKGSRQQKVGTKRRSSQADPDMAGLREQWRPSVAQLRSLLASCLSALAQNAGAKDAPQAQDRAVALRRVAGMLLQQLQAVQGEGDHVHADQLQRFLEVSTADALVARTASGHNMQEVSEALLTASARQKELMQTATAGTAGASQKPTKKARWCLEEDWVPCALGMLPSPHHPCGRMPLLDIAPCQYQRLLADAEAAEPVTETLQQPAANPMAANLGTAPALTDSTSTEAS
ncbi:g1791 [Coccomyxa elongata]